MFLNMYFFWLCLDFQKIFIFLALYTSVLSFVDQCVESYSIPFSPHLLQVCLFLHKAAFSRKESLPRKSRNLVRIDGGPVWRLGTHPLSFVSQFFSATVALLCSSAFDPRPDDNSSGTAGRNVDHNGLKLSDEMYVVWAYSVRTMVCSVSYQPINELQKSAEVIPASLRWSAIKLNLWYRNTVCLSETFTTLSNRHSISLTIEKLQIEEDNPHVVQSMFALSEISTMIYLIQSYCYR